MTRRAPCAALGVHVSELDLWTMLLSTIRYSMGRMTYLPSTCHVLVARYRAHLAPHQLDQIRRELEAELHRVRTANYGDRLLGMKCDDDTWCALVRDLGGTPPEAP